ncbi:DUF6090 family protein [Croceiramulus getboli]|nr:DUF6090 family protein [Flavobacteriaceae bacterium YJPT1-3]
MIAFFRRLRKKVLAEGSTAKYFKYALGEIILVVIGILIALQINNWNIDRQTRIKEQAYLKEIRNNLGQDSLQLALVLDFNKNKERIVEEMIGIFSDTLNNEERFQIFNKHANNFTFYQVFDPVRIAFTNMLSAESIDLIRSSELREDLSVYYNYPYLDGIQNRIAVINRRVVDVHFPKFFSKEFVSEWIGISSEMPEVNELNIASDQEFMADLFGVKMIISVQNELIRATQKSNQQLIALVESEINK